MSSHRRSEEDALLARYVRYRKPRDFARLFDRTAPDLLRRAQVIDPDRAPELVKATYRSILFAETNYAPRRRCRPFLFDLLLQHGLPKVAACTSQRTARATGNTGPRTERDLSSPGESPRRTVKLVPEVGLEPTRP